MRRPQLAALLGVIAGLSLTAYVAQGGSSYRDPVLASTVQVPPPVVAAPVAGPARPAPTAATTRSRARADLAWVAATARRAGIPPPAQRAYAAATLRVPPSCGLGWTTLAGIGWVESAHGTTGGRTVAADGVPSEPVLGPALDGRGPVAAIAATARSALWHGDARWDHAVGPMQFIPSTWATWAADGDGDGRTDPHDLDDAALAAARYLCASGSLASGPGWSAAVFSYNHDDDYVRAVHAAATTYADRTG